MRTRSILLSSLVLAIAGCQVTEAPTADIKAAPAAQPSASSATFTPDALAIEAGLSTQDGVQDAAQRNRQRQAYLADKAIGLGEEALAQLDLQEALAQFSRALEVMPSNETARERLRHTRALLGDEYANISVAFDDMVERERVRQAIARLDVEQFTLDGDNHLLASDYDAAVESYRRAEMILRYHPLVATDTLDEKIVSAKLASATQLAMEARNRQDAAAKDEAARLRAAAEEEQRDYRAKKLGKLYSDANRAFEQENYSLAETLAEQVLLYDPGNEHALRLTEIATAARHQKTAEDHAASYEKQWLKTFDDLNQLGVLQMDNVVFDAERWKKVRTRVATGTNLTGAGISPDKEMILEVLREKRVSARFGEDDEGAALSTIANYLQSIAGVNFVLSSTVKENDITIALDLDERSVYSLLNIIAEITEELDWKIENGVVNFVAPEELLGGQVLQVYRIDDLTNPIQDFPGREINISPSNDLPEVDEDIEEREFLVLDEGTLEELIRTSIDAESWDADETNSLNFSGGQMIVNQTPENQIKIQELLADLREAIGIMVDIQARFLTVEDNFLEDIGVEFHGLGSPGAGTSGNFFNDFGDASAQQTLGNEIGTGRDLGAFFAEGDSLEVSGRTENLFDQFLGDEDVLTNSGGLQFQWVYLNDLQLELILTAVSKSERVELVTAPQILIYNTARANISVLNQVAYVKDFDVEIAMGSSIADPIIGVVEDGVVLDVRPAVSADRRFVILDLRPTVAQLRRPIQTFTTSLGVSGNSVTIHLPELDITKVRTTIPMPDGSTVLLGGMKIHEEKNFSSGVPILNKIPLVSFLFNRQGTYITNRKLLTLIKASIVILSESEPTAPQLGLDKSLQLNPR